MMFRNVLNKGNQVKPNMWRKFVGAIFGDSYSDVIRFYDCPCDDKNDPDKEFKIDVKIFRWIFTVHYIKLFSTLRKACECWDSADKLLTDFTWYCNQRYFLRKYKKSKRPIYSWLLSQTEFGVIEESSFTKNRSQLISLKHETNKAIHGIGQFFFFNNRYNLTGAEELWARSYQNYLGNFIRTGDPNG